LPVSGVNETISSLLLTYIAAALFNHFVEGPLRDPSSLNKPSTREIAPPTCRHHPPHRRPLGPGAGLWRLCLRADLHTTFGSPPASPAATCAPPGGRLGVGRLVSSCASAAALPGCRAWSLAAVQAAPTPTSAGYGFTGILCLLARHNPLAVIPVAILLAE
jgi:simple sugar transport system permease protein